MWIYQYDSLESKSGLLLQLGKISENLLLKENWTLIFITWSRKQDHISQDTCVGNFFQMFVGYFIWMSRCKMKRSWRIYHSCEKCNFKENLTIFG